MPSQKTAEKTVEKKAEVKLIEVIAVRKFAVDYTEEELKQMRGKDKEKRDHIGMSRLIDAGESALIPKDVAEKLQNAGAVKVKL